MKPGLLIALAELILGAALASEFPSAALIRIDGTIGPATAGYIVRSLRVAASNGHSCLIIELDTPGGLLDSTKEIVQAFYGSSIPVVVFVAPAGAGATSAGCFITLAADVAAMAPSTTIGAAHPVSLGGPGEGQTDDTMKQKVESYATSYIEAIAVKRKRDVEWARSAVRDSASITAEQALQRGVIELIASDVPDLLRQLNGREVGGRTLHTAPAVTTAIPMLARERIFQILWRPEVMFILMLIAIYGIIGELTNPGVILPGVAGGIALILALYMAAILPINVAGLALIGLAVGLFVTDVFATTHGVLTAGGIVSFFLGSLMLFDRAGPAFRLSPGLIVPATLITAAFFSFVVGAGLRAQALPVKTGRGTLLGRTVPALTRISADGGKVFVEGEYWTGVSETPVEPGQSVEVVGVQGLTLKVKPKP